jgi:hypothetical protein
MVKNSIAPGTQGFEGYGFLTFLCLHSSHLGIELSSAIFLLFRLGSGEGEVGSGFTSMLSPTESTVGDWEHGDMGTWDDLQSEEKSDEDQEKRTVM